MVKSCRHATGSLAPIIGWAETAQLEEHDTTFTFDIEALYRNIQDWPGVGGLCLFDVVERAIGCLYFPGRVSCEDAAPCPVYTAHAVRRFLSRSDKDIVHLVLNAQAY